MKINKIISALFLAAALASAPSVQAKLNLGKIVQAGQKTIQAFTITDAQMAEYVKASVAQMDAQNKVLGDNSPYTVRLKKLTQGLTSVDGIPLNFKVYQTTELNAFACPDGSVRVYTGLMDKMTDDELLGVIGHEIGHVAKHHSKNAFKHELLTGALKDVISSSGGVVGTLTDSQLGELGMALSSAKFSKKQETEADDYGYEFLKKNGRNPWGMAYAFRKLMGDEDASSSSYIQKMFSSHPDTKSRIERVEKRCKKEGIAEPAKQ